MSAQERYEMENSDELKRVAELQREGHDCDCAAGMVKTGGNCHCKMEEWLLKWKEGER